MFPSFEIYVGYLSAICSSNLLITWMHDGFGCILNFVQKEIFPEEEC